MEALTYGIFDTEHTAEIRRELAESGHRVIEFPDPEVRSISPKLNSIDGFSWVVFADLFSAELFLAYSALADSLGDVRVCAVGAAVAERLRLAQVHYDIVPVRSSTSEIVGSIRRYETEIIGARVLVVAGEGVSVELTKELTAAGAEPTIVHVYRQTGVSSAEIARLRAYLVGGAIDRFVISCPEDIDRLRILFKDTAPAELLAGIAAIAPGKDAWRAAYEHGIAAEFGLK